MESNCSRVKLTLATIPANTLSVTNMSSRTVPCSLERLTVLIASKRKREKKEEKFYYLGNRVPNIERTVCYRYRIIYRPLRYLHGALRK